jgi:hypothetical protein
MKGLGGGGVGARITMSLTIFSVISVERSNRIPEVSVVLGVGVGMEGTGAGAEGRGGGFETSVALLALRVT